MGSSNMIDGPALEWLTRQSSPRVWLSAGGVTGVGDVQGTENRRYAEELCVRGRITHLETIEEFLRFLGH